VLLGAEVWGACDSELNMDATHPLYRGQLGHMFGADSQRRLENADAVLIVGTYAFPEVFPLLDWPFRPGARIVHIDLDTYEIAKNFPVNVALAAHPKPTLALLAESLAAGAGSRQRITQEQTERVRVTADRPALAQPPDGAPLLDVFAAELARQAPADLVVFDEALTASPALAAYLPARHPGGFHATRGGSLGVGLPGAIGVKLARPEAQVVGFAGDGGSMYTFQALWTAARHGIPARFVICNNCRYRILDRNIEHYWTEQHIPPHAYPDAFDLAHPRIDFAGLAASLGVAAERVDKPDQAEAAVTRLLGHPGPYLIDLDTE
jgi:benzoylformate decarboxylase